MPDRLSPEPETFQALMDSLSDPRKLGGHVRSLGIVSRLLQRPIKTMREAETALAAVSESEALNILRELGARMPDLSLNTVFAVRRLYRPA